MKRDFIKSVGVAPDHIIFNRDKEYWELTWGADEDEYLCVKLGIRLAQKNSSGKVVHVMWVRFKHEVSYNAKMYPWFLSDQETYEELVYNCRDAIQVLHSTH
jgi:hypothetical protein